MPFCNADIPDFGFGTAFEIVGHEVADNLAPVVSGAAYQSKYLTSHQFKHLTRAAIDLGVRHFDCAPLYRTQNLVGQVLSERFATIARGEFFITSKISPNMMRVQHLQRCLERSLCELRVAYLDCLLLHAPFAIRHVCDDDIYPIGRDGLVMLDEQDNVLEAAWRELARLKRLGLARYIGICNVNESQIRKLDDIYHIDVVQNEWNVCKSKTIIDLCAGLGIHFEAFGVMGSVHKARELNKPLLMDEPHIKHLAAAANMTCAEVLLRLTKRTPCSFVLRSDTVGQLRANWAVPKSKTGDELLVTSEILQNLHKVRCDVIVNSYEELPGLVEHREYPWKALE